MTKRGCEFDGCEKPYLANGLCGGHNVQRSRGVKLRPLRQYGRGNPHPGCTFLGCERPHKAKGLCDPHVRQQRRGEQLREVREYTLTVEERFWAKVNKTETCWLWTGTLRGPFHGGFTVSTRVKVYAHRFAWELINGVPEAGWYHYRLNPSGVVIDHDNPEFGCGNPLCVNPAHLDPVAHKTNTQRKRNLAANNRSGVRGVSWDRGKKCWVVQVGSNGKNYHGGYFHGLAAAETAAIALRERLFNAEAA
jgi:hypothetical protein